MVETLYFVPQWFYKFDIILGIIFFLTTALVATYARRLYTLTQEREFNLFSISFGCIALSYLLRMYLNIFLTKTVEKAQGVLSLVDINLFSKAIIYIYVMLFIIGYLTLFYTTLKIKGSRVYIVMLLLSMIAIAWSMNKSFTVYFIAAVFLLGIVYHYARFAIKHKWKEGRTMLAATMLLLISTVEFMLIADYHFYEGYIISNTIELIAYAIIAYRLYRIIGYGEKKK